MNASSIALIFDYARTAALLAIALFGYADIRCKLLERSRWMLAAWDILFFVCFTVLSMQVEVVLLGNVPVNFRAVAIAFAALFGGPWAALAAAAAGLLVRTFMGGTNMPLGTVLILAALVVGLSCRWWIARRGRAIGYLDLLLVGVLLDGFRILGWFAVLGRAATLEAIDVAWIGVLLMLPVTVFLLGATIIVAGERRLLARSVADSEARFRNVVDQLPNSLSLVDLDDRFTFVNQAQTALVGIPAAEQLGKTRQETWDRAGAGPVPRDYLEKVVATGKALTTNLIHFPRLDKPAWIIGTVFPVHDAQGNVKEIGSVGVDVTELWQAREEVARREEMLQRLTTALVEAVRSDKIGTDSLPVAVQKLTEIAGDALGVERTGVFCFDLEANEVERVDLWLKSTKTHLPREITSKSTSWYETGLMDRDEVMAVEDTRSDPRMIELAAHLRAADIGAMLAAPMFVNGHFKGIVTFSHVSEPRHWAVEEIGFARSVADIVSLLYLTDRYREALAALDLIEDGIYIEEKNSRVIYANRRAMELARGKIAPPQDGQLALRTFPATFPYVQRPLQGAQDRYETTLDFGAGHRDFQIARDRLPEGGTIVLIRDLTQRNRALRERQRLENQLLQASKLEAIGQLAGGVAHDFNNLLGAIMGFARFIEEDLPDDSNHNKYARRIVAACERGKSIVTQITSFSRAQQVERGVVDLAALVRDSRDLLAGLVRPTTQLSVDVAETGLFALGNEGQMTQILVNLVANANDALEGHAGTIAVKISRVGRGEDAVETEERQLSFLDDKYRRRRILGQLDPESEYARIDVADSGKGIASRIVPRIFDPFYTNKRNIGGTGLGLAVVHSIVGSYDGVLYLDTIVGRGTTFSIYLPLLNNVDADRVSGAARAQNQGSERVLIVDDDVDVADMMSIGLARLGYEVAVSNDPLEALEAFTEEPQGWDVAVIDRMMPEMDGVELAMMLKAVRDDIRIILCTGVDNGVVELSEDGRGYDLLFVKPVSPDQVAGAIRRLFDE